ncbi:MAG: hypothetical protein HY563_04760 [Ignavibacteriales bacterium]|nr:hypothetical protein [Ignavibacteriales bacterium]
MGWRTKGAGDIGQRVSRFLEKERAGGFSDALNDKHNRAIGGIAVDDREGDALTGLFETDNYKVAGFSFGGYKGCVDNEPRDGGGETVSRECGTCQETAPSSMMQLMGQTSMALRMSASSRSSAG